MKYLLPSLFILLFFNACSYKNAYSSFDMNKTSELVESNTLSSKIESKNGVIGLISVTYLNNIYKTDFKNEEVFLISLYMKDKQTEYSLKLNHELALKTTKVTENDKFFNLLINKNSWNDNYLISFKKSGVDLNLSLEVENSSSLMFKYLKE